MRSRCLSLLTFVVAVMISGCHHIDHIRDIRAAGDGKLYVEKCDYYINGFWGTGGYQDCRIDTISVK